MAPELSLAASGVVGAAMLVLALSKRAVYRPRRRRCPSCGRYAELSGCRCTKH